MADRESREAAPGRRSSWAADPLLYDSHVHTPYCGHAVGRPAAYVWQACRRNLKGLAFTCHNPMPAGFTPSVRMPEEHFPAYIELVTELQETFRGISDVKLGLECDWLPGFEDYLIQQVASAPFEFVIGSLHAHFPEYHALYVKSDPVEAQRTYFEMLAESAETGLFDSLAHPDQIKNVFPDAWDVDRVMDVIGNSLDRIAAAGVSMELNTSGLYKAIPEMNPGPVILSAMHDRGIPVVLGSDAHQPERLGDEFELALDTLQKIGFTHVSYYANRTRHQVEIEAARNSLTLC